MRKIKKYICTLAFAMMMLVGAFSLTACGDPVAVGIEIKESSIKTEVAVGSEYDLSSLVIKLIYDNGEEEEISSTNDDVIITPIDTTVLGDQKLKVKYKDFQDEVTINVALHEDLYEVLGFETPNFYTLYKNSIADADRDNDNEFAVGDSVYKVGDQNPFKFLPIITGVDDEGDSVTFPAYTSKVTVKVGGTEKTGDDLTELVAVDTANSTFDFTPEAVGTVFDITVQPEDMPDDATYSPITFTVKVVEGWNAYNEADLSRIESNELSAEYWALKKQQTGIDNTAIKGIVLHRDMEIKKSDLPSTFFYDSNASAIEGIEVANTLKDEYSFYTRDILAGEDFSIYGNYFTIKTRNEGNDAIPMVEYLQRDRKFSHAAIFSFGGDNNGSPDDRQGEVYIENLSMKGNGSREGGTNPHNHKGLIGILTSAEKITLENVITRAFTSHIIAVGDYTYEGAENIACYINNSKMIDSFQALMLAWGSRNNYITNSVLKDSGGPLVVSTHADVDEGTHMFANVTVVNSVLESLVGGQEAWFSKNHATPIFTQLDSLNTTLNDISRGLISQDIGVTKIASFRKDNKYNFYTVNMESGAIDNTLPIESKISIYGESADEEDLLSKQDMTDAMINKFVNFTLPGTDVKPFSSGKVMNTPLVFECGGSYVTINFMLDEDKMMKDFVILIDDEAIVGAANQEQGTNLEFIPISLGELIRGGNALYQIPAFKAIIDQKIVNFFQNGEFVNIYMGGQSLGATCQMFHLDVQN